MKKLGQCEVKGCQNEAKYGLFKTYPNGRKVWLHVCPLHEREIGNENLRRAEIESDKEVNY